MKKIVIGCLLAIRLYGQEEPEWLDIRWTPAYQSLLNEEIPAEERASSSADAAARPQCPICGKSFAHSGYLPQHIRTHTGEKPYGCDICGKHFNDESDLDKHTRTHTKEAPYACNVCGKRFSDASNRSTHMHSHTEEQNYVCAICGKRYKQNAGLSRHKRIHKKNPELLQNTSISAPAKRLRMEPEDELPPLPIIDLQELQHYTEGHLALDSL